MEKENIEEDNPKLFLLGHITTIQAVGGIMFPVEAGRPKFEIRIETYTVTSIDLEYFTKELMNKELLIEFSEPTEEMRIATHAKQRLSQ